MSIIVLIVAIIAIAVGADASDRYRGVLMPTFWFFGTLVLAIAFVPAYLIVRPPKS